jgi:hypothetical protein
MVLAALIPIFVMVVDDRVELFYVIVFLVIWIVNSYRIFKRQQETVAELEEFIAALQSETVAQKSLFLKAESKMPRLLAKMRDDLANDETQLIREFWVSPNINALWSESEPKFKYWERDHDYLDSKVGLLEEYGFVVQIRESLYRMTDEFVDLLTGTNEAA